MTTELKKLILQSIDVLGDNAYGVPVADEVERLRGKRLSTIELYRNLSDLEKQGLITS